MNEKSTPGPASLSREDRLKFALKANLARRKAQARARQGAEAGQRPVTDDTATKDMGKDEQD